MSRQARIAAYVAGTSAVGLASVVLLIRRDPLDAAAFDGAFWVLGALVVLTELIPLRVPRGDREDQLTLSSTFGFALLLVSGPTAAALWLGASVLLADLSSRKALWRTSFNVAQYVLPVATAGLLLDATGTWWAGAGAIGPLDLLAAAVAGALFAAVNVLVMAGLVAIVDPTEGRGIRGLAGVVRHDAPFVGWSYAVLISLGPVVALTAEASSWAIPLFVIPTVAVYQATAIYLERQRTSLHDVLTGLPNRALFEDRVTQAIAGGRRAGTRTAVLVLNLDQFKEVNSTLGYHVGDRLLKEVANRLRRVIREVDTVARLGADEFGLVLVGVSSAEDAESVVQELRTAVVRPFVVDRVALAVEASVGGAISPDDGVDAAALIAAADETMDEAKLLRAGHRWYAPARRGQLAGRMQLLAELREALDAGELELHYQPKASLRTGDITGVEALVRWRRAGAELVPPAEFVPVAEQTGIMGDLTRYVLRRAIVQARTWRDAGVDLPVAVNISARDLLDPQLVTDVGALLEEEGLAASALELEITESSIMSDVERAVATLSQLHAMGVTLAIDDFGTGNTSLAQLPRLPVDVLKIDRSFVQRLESGPDDLIVRTTIELGRGLGLKVVAEGVSTYEVWRRLLALGCDDAQGFYLSRPVIASEVDLMVGRAAAS